MKVLLILLGLVACAAASCNNLQRFKVKSQWSHTYGHDISREAFGTAMWKAIFAQAPESRALFTRVHGDDLHSGEFKAHSARVLGGLDMIISMLDNDATLASMLDHLHTQHEARHIPGEYFDAFKNALLKVVPATMGRCFDKEAWSDCFDVIEHGIDPEHH